MTTRDPDALLIRKWAESGDVQTPEAEGLTRATGWPSSYSQVGGDTPSRETFNQMFREITGMLSEINQKGILVWDATVNYEHPAYVLDPVNFRIYLSVRDNINKVPRTSTDDWKPAFPADGGYVPRLFSLPATLTDFDDIDDSLFRTSEDYLVWFRADSALVDNRPFNVPTTVRMECLLMRRNVTPANSNLTLRCFLSEHDTDTLKGISYFERFSTNSGASWSQWGAYPVLASVLIENARQSNPTIRRRVNVEAVSNPSNGHYILTLTHFPSLSGTSGYPTGYHVTPGGARDLGGTLTAWVDEVTLSSDSPPKGLVEINTARNTTHYEPYEFSFTSHMEAV